VQHTGQGLANDTDTPGKAAQMTLPRFDSSGGSRLAAAPLFSWRPFAVEPALELLKGCAQPSMFWARFDGAVLA